MSSDATFGDPTVLLSLPLRLVGGPVGGQKFCPELPEPAGGDGIPYVGHQPQDEPEVVY